ncbi:phage tail protein [Stenotrophomonas maltophilia]|uniref:phage tail protein n=1 Tax=Stenotrophomonas maltophilia TaxID=40324 RepID=UPI0013DBF110|nr:tail fiber protein [Stenotrophomonas maltophilia]
MSQPFIGQIMPLAFPFAPRSFAYCNGQVMPIAQNQVLFSLLGTFYGGNGTTTFQLPDLRGRTPVGSNAGSNIGQPGGVEGVVLNVSQMPAHNHSFNGTTTTATTRIPAGNVLLGAAGTQNIYGPSSGTPVALAPLDTAGQSAAHSNMQPYLAINFCIALQGVFPSRS